MTILEAIEKFKDKLGIHYEVMHLSFQIDNSFNYNKIAEYLNIPLGTVKSRINRGKIKLNQLIEQENETAKV
jgi:hypothetical protein